jgi:hypothetical protein
MKSILSFFSSLVVIVTQLLSAEAVALRRIIVHLSWALHFILISALLALAGICFLLWALYQSLAVPLGSSLAAVFAGSVAVLLSVLCWAIARWHIR